MSLSLKNSNTFSSKDYWEKRYKEGGNSGVGSYSNLAEFKAEIINEFVFKNKINTVIEWGCGDGNQLTLANYKEYLGYDVSQTAVKDKFKGDESKRFVWSGYDGFKNEAKADLALSLDVIYHLIEEETFEIYMNQLFDSSSKYVIIYSCNELKYNKNQSRHVKCRVFTDWIKEKRKDWVLIQYIRNRFPLNMKNFDHTSFSDFFIYEKIGNDNMV